MTNPNPTKPLWPSNFQGCTVSGTYVFITGDPVSGSVQFMATPTVLLDPAAETIIIPIIREAVLDNNGHFSIVLPATDDPDVQPIDWTYLVTEKFEGGRVYQLDAPQNTSIDLVDFSPVPESGGTATVATPGITLIAADARYEQASDAIAAMSAEVTARDAAIAAAAASLDGEIAYAENISGVNIVAGLTQTDLFCQVVIPPSTRPIWVEADCSWQITVAGAGTLFLVVYDVTAGSPGTLVQGNYGGARDVLAANSGTWTLFPGSIPWRKRLPPSNTTKVYALYCQLTRDTSSSLAAKVRNIANNPTYISAVAR